MDRVKNCMLKRIWNYWPENSSGDVAFKQVPLHVPQCAVDPLHHTVGLWMVGGGGDMLHPLLLAPVSPRARGELGPPVSSDAGWHAKAGHPCCDEGLQHRLHINPARVDRSFMVSR